MKIDKIDDKIYLSGFIDNYNQLDNIDNVINVRSEDNDDIIQLSDKNIAYYWIPVGDYIAPRKSQIYAFIDIIKKCKGTVLVHCAEGRGRSAMLCVIYMMYFHDYELEEAHAYVKARRPEMALTDEHMKKLEIMQNDFNNL